MRGFQLLLQAASRCALHVEIGAVFPGDSPQFGGRTFGLGPLVGNPSFHGTGCRHRRRQFGL